MACCQPIIIPDPSDPVFGPSAVNIPVPSMAPGTPPTKNVNNDTAVLFYTIASNFFEQPTATSNYVYRLTLNMFLSNATPGGAGNITLSVLLVHTDATDETIGTQTIYLPNKVIFGGTAVGNGFSLSTEFIPRPGDTMKIYLYNDTGATLTGVMLEPTTKGNCISLVSKASAPTLIFS